jgi:hypothetical protein
MNYDQPFNGLLMKKITNMDGDPSKQTITRKEVENLGSSASDIFQPSWLRCPFSFSDDMDRVILDYGCNFLWRIGIAIWVIFLVAETI